MNYLQSKNGEMTSLEICDQINIFRSELENRKPLRHADLLNIIKKEFEEEIGERKISLSSYTTPQNKKMPMYILSLSQAKQVLMRESKVVRKAVIKYIETLEDKLQEAQIISPAQVEIQELKSMVFELTKVVTSMLNPPAEEVLTQQEEVFLKQVRRKMNDGYILPSEVFSMLNVTRPKCLGVAEELGIIYRDENNIYFTKEYDNDEFGRYRQWKNGNRTYVVFSKKMCLELFRMKMNGKF